MLPAIASRLSNRGWNVLGSVALQQSRSISLTSTNNMKEIRETKQGKSLIVEGVIMDSPRKHLLVKPDIVPTADGKKSCYMCALDLDLKHTDVLILSQFIRNDGCMLPRRITGLCSKQQKRIGTMVTMAQKAGLMLNFTPPNCKRDISKRKDYKKFNTYYDESTIVTTYQPKPKKGLFRYLNNM